MSLEEFAALAAARQPLSRADTERILASEDLISIGVLGETARQARAGNRVTYGRVAVVEESAAPQPLGDAGEVRLVGVLASMAAARERVQAATTAAADTPITGFSLSDLLTLAEGNLRQLSSLSRQLHADGMVAVADVAIDRFSDDETLIAAVQAAVAGGLGVWRATVDQAASMAERLNLIDRVAALQRATGVLRAFAPLPRVDSTAAPSTGYDDVRTVAAARLVLADVPAIQVDWTIYGPKLAQVAIAFGASDIDGIAAVDDLQLGQRRSPKTDIERQIRAAAAEPAERNGRYELRA